ncbi:MAG: phasin family protein [Rhodocyclaceae bacterium]
MVRKLRQMAEGVTENQLAAMIRESTQQIWLAGLGAFAKAQAEGGKVFEALVKEGELVQAKTRKVAEDKVVDLSAKASGTWDKLEKVFEDRVARALHSMGVPTKQDIATLSQRVAALTEAVERLSGGEAPAAGAKPRARTQRKAQ